MPYYDREEKILSALLEKDHMTTQELAAKLFVSQPTLRRDLVKLEQKGRIIRTHGGAQLVKQSADEKIPFFLREQEQNDAKSIIAQRAVRFIRDGNIIMLDGSTSAYNIVPHLSAFKNLIVITSSAKSSFLLGRMGINNICTGGRMIPVLHRRGCGADSGSVQCGHRVLLCPGADNGWDPDGYSDGRKQPAQSHAPSCQKAGASLRQQQAEPCLSE